MARETTSVWRQLFHLKKTSPVIYYTIIILFVAEILVSWVAPLFIPDNWYLSLYLKKKAKEQTLKFSKADTDFLIFDPVTGWRSKPNSRKGNWIIDEHGARTTHVFGKKPQKPVRVMFLGSSLVNGGTKVSNRETISAYVEDSLFEAVNFATMLYSFDQMCLAFEKGLFRFHPAIIVVGLSVTEGEGLTNRYIPFRFPSEVNMPFFKPRFKFQRKKLRLIPVPSRNSYEQLFQSSVMLKRLKTTDEFYAEFENYKRFGLLPISGGLSALAKKIRNFIHLFKAPPCLKNISLLENEMRHLVFVGKKHKAAVIFMLLPARNDVFRTGWRRRSLDQYQILLSRLQSDNFNIMDVRASLRQSGLAGWKLFSPDNHHYTAAGNKIIAASLHQKLMSVARQFNADFAIRAAR